MESPKTFPIMAVGGCHAFNLPWDLIAPHEAQAVANHGQTLERLAARGGLSPVEAWLVMHGLATNAYGDVTPREARAFFTAKVDALAAKDADLARLRAQAALFDAQRAAVARELAGLGVEYGTPDDYARAAAEELSRLRAELARLNGIIDADRKISSAAMVRMTDDLAAARAAVDREREALAEAATIIRTRHGDKYHERNAAHFLERYDARRAARLADEAKPDAPAVFTHLPGCHHANLDHNRGDVRCRCACFCPRPEPGARAAAAKEGA